MPAAAPVEVRLIEPGELTPLWPKVAGSFAWSNMPGAVSLPAVRNLLLSGYSRLWVAPDWQYPSRLAGVIVTTVIRRPRKEPCLKIEFLSGRHIGTWIDSAARNLGRYAKAHGCTDLEFIGRIGWHEYRRLFDLPNTWRTEARAASRCRPQPPPPTNRA